MINKEFEHITKYDQRTKIKFQTNENVFCPTATSDFLIRGVADNINYADKLLDLGCGNGVVGITLSKLEKVKKIYCSDISKEAVKIANINIKLNHIIGKAIFSDIFSNWDNYKFDVIVNDVSGIAEEVASISSWFENVPCDSGLDGCKNINKVLNEGKKFLVDNGKIFFPVISLSNTKKILDLANQNYNKLSMISHDEWFLPDELLDHLTILRKLKNQGFIDYCEKFGRIICWTDIYMVN